MKAKMLCLLSVILVVAMGNVAMATQWDGGGDGVLWSDPLNWAGDAKPAGAHAEFGYTVGEDVDCNSVENLSNPGGGQLYMCYGGGTNAAILNIEAGGDLYVAQAFVNGGSTLNVNAGQFKDQWDMYLGFQTDGTINVDGGTFWVENVGSGLCFVGHVGGDGTLNVKSGLADLDNNVYVGYGNGTASVGVIDVTGGTLDSATGIYLGFDSTGTGTMTISGGQVNTGTLEVGHGGTGSMTVSGGALDVSGATYVGTLTGSNSTMTIDGDADVELKGSVYVGYQGGTTGVLDINDANICKIKGNLMAGYAGTGTVNINVASDIGYMYPGFAGGTGIINVNADVEGVGDIGIGYNSSGNGTINVASGVLLTTYSMYIPSFGGDGTATGHLQVNGGIVMTMILNGNGAGPNGEAFILGTNGGTGTLDVNGGVVLLRGDYSADVAAAITAGDITADNGAGTAVSDYDTTYPGYTCIYSQSAGAPELCLAATKPAADLDDDCDVDLADLAIMASEWLNCGTEPYGTGCPASTVY